MSKMKHLLRKLHIGSAFTDHPHHRPAVEPIPQGSDPSPSSLLPDAPSSSTSLVEPPDSSDAVSDFSFFEEEFQVQLALAISVSDPDSRDDPETAQINAAKQISLGRSPSPNPVDFLSLRYWSYNVINYDEKVMDGFYDVYGINPNSVVQGKMPLLTDLQSTSVSDNVDYEVILVNRASDLELRQLEEKVCFISMECQSLNQGSVSSVLVERIADLVVEKMGGPVNDVEEMSKRWTMRSYELRTSLNTIVLPLGCIDLGLSRHRALLFKVLADRINLPCKLIKGSCYTGTDEGSVNLIKFDNASEYIVDVMGAPGALIPAEVPGGQPPHCSIDGSVTPDLRTFKNSCLEFVNGAGQLSSPLITGTKSSNSTLEPYVDGIKSGGYGKIVTEGAQSGYLGNGHRDLILSLNKLCEGSSVLAENMSAAQKLQIDGVSNHVISASRDPDFLHKLHSVLRGSSEAPSPVLFSNANACSVGGQTVPGKDESVQKECSFDTQCYPKMQTSTSLVVQELVFKAAFPNASDESSFDASANPFGQPEVGQFERHTHKEIVNSCNNLERDKEASENLIELEDASQSNDYRSSKEHTDPILGEVAEWEISWEDLRCGERIGIGSYGEVYKADWNGTEVAVKKFMNQDISGNALLQFKCEVEIMLRLRHPNLVLFMGAVTRPPNLSILTEYLPRGSLYKLLHRPNTQIDEKRRLRMALDVAKGMNYLHTSHPVIVHRDLKSPNLLVNKNWVVKVCDFGMSRMKYHTFLSSKSTAGTAEWMAPEVLRNEPSNEKSDVYSFGVILWELATLRVPWTGMNSMQVVGAVGFQGRHLDIPDHVDPDAARIISDCWNHNPNGRPSFAQIIVCLKSLQRLVVDDVETCTDKQ